MYGKDRRDPDYDPSPNRIYQTCEICGEDIEDGEDYWVLDGKIHCADCKEEYLRGCMMTCGEEFDEDDYI